jgi:hypothetical protein
VRASIHSSFGRLAAKDRRLVRYLLRGGRIGRGIKSRLGTPQGPGALATGPHLLMSSESLRTRC